MRPQEHNITYDLLSRLVRQYEALDDVWSPRFLEMIILQALPGSQVESSAMDWFAEQGVKYLSVPTDILITNSTLELFTLLPSTDTNLETGPYFSTLSDGCIHARRAYLLYDDNLQAFTQAIAPAQHSGTYSSVSLYNGRYRNLLVPVPSRLYSIDDPRPLAGLRVAVKDLYAIDGIAITGGSKAHAAVYPERNNTATAIAQLIELGAVLVGVTKTSQFAFGIPPRHWNDDQYPFNPRGDGQLATGVSSAGSGAAIAGYSWLDITIGSDTSGSVRIPASLGGTYGVRPSWGAQDMSNILPLGLPFDTAGFFTRDPHLFSTMGPLWYDQGEAPFNETFASFPQKLLYPVDYWPLRNPDAQRIYDDFLNAVSREFGMVRSDVNVTAILTESDLPVANSSASILGLFQTSVAYDSYHGIGEALIEGWEALYPDRGYPPLDNETRSWYSIGPSIGEDAYSAMLQGKQELADLLNGNFFQESVESCSDGIMILETGASGLPNYREDYLNETPGAGPMILERLQEFFLNPVFLSPITGGPEVSIPIGQVEYESPISQQTEYLPVNINLLARPGCDGMLFALIKALADKGIVKTVLAGRTAY
ncbi:hypothetical protein PV10_03359 [Exophiala mesophila]|uniref:Uncharacterized protein n=1 Tax=Exophiala mesophila TaxID=212818 RepID=A0A0D2A9U7_EXOME|nr:uncharacterized protein PV10_03359 [Exophiala mesophila]KIV95743.1 hypothetical protein PV10_03359 [Exophiala mesophila]